MMKLSMATGCSNLPPSVLLDQSDDIADSHVMGP
jgi:hypothetical protein